MSLLKLKKELDKQWEETKKKRDKSPCVFKGDENFSDCSKCDGLMLDCPARSPECDRKHEDGRWRQSTPW